MAMSWQIVLIILPTEWMAVKWTLPRSDIAGGHSHALVVILQAAACDLPHAGSVCPAMARQLMNSRMPHLFRGSSVPKLSSIRISICRGKGGWWVVSITMHTPTVALLTWLHGRQTAYSTERSSIHQKSAQAGTRPMVILIKKEQQLEPGAEAGCQGVNMNTSLASLLR